MRIGTDTQISQSATQFSSMLERGRLANVTNPAAIPARAARQSSSAPHTDQELTLKATVEHDLIQVAPSRRWAYA